MVTMTYTNNQIRIPYFLFEQLSSCVWGNCPWYKHNHRGITLVFSHTVFILEKSWVFSEFIISSICIYDLEDCTSFLLERFLMGLSCIVKGRKIDMYNHPARNFIKQKLWKQMLFMPMLIGSDREESIFNSKTKILKWKT